MTINETFDQLTKEWKDRVAQCDCPCSTERNRAFEEWVIYNLAKIFGKKDSLGRLEVDESKIGVSYNECEHDWMAKPVATSNPLQYGAWCRKCKRGLQLTASEFSQMFPEDHGKAQTESGTVGAVEDGS